MNPLPSLKLLIKLNLDWNRDYLIAHPWCREATEELCLGERVWGGGVVADTAVGPSPHPVTLPTQHLVV